jgi:hypothetical protein
VQKGLDEKLRDFLAISKMGARPRLEGRELCRTILEQKA